MATSFVSVPLKVSSEVDLNRPFKTFIENTYGVEEGGEDYGQAIKEFTKLRTNVCCKALDKHESSLDSLHRYYDQLIAIDAKLPITENQFEFALFFPTSAVFMGVPQQLAQNP
ncbi:programmed cell death 6-interacting protein-like [Saccoglossus kowalevskii]